MGTGADADRQPVVGMVGAGQLARMTAAAAIGLGIRFRVLAAAADESAAQVTAGAFVGDFRSDADLAAFAADCDVVTFDHEHVPQEQLAALERAGHTVLPSAAALWFTQDKLAMREQLTKLGVACPRYRPVATAAEVADFAEQVGGAGQPAWPVVLKAVSGGYDGRGVWICDSIAEAAAVLSHGVSMIAEEYVQFERELAILIARSPSGHGAAYPLVQTVQQDGICREVLAPAPGLNPDLAVDAERLGLALARDLDVVGMLAVELFETRGGLMVNELAMRPHNSGHWTIEGARTSQFEQHLRAVLNLPLGSPVLAAPAVATANVLGGADPDLRSRLNHVMAADPAVKVHLYGKPVRPGRKVGHVTALGDEHAEVRDRARRAANYLATGSEDYCLPEEEL
ncbi:MAG: 5-(carboxyamino)imidazole ribonucleotide synthase [Streptosporangiaceae bacterium]